MRVAEPPLATIRPVDLRRAGSRLAGPSLAEEFEMMIRLRRYRGDHRLPYRVRFNPDAVC